MLRIIWPTLILQFAIAIRLHAEVPAAAAMATEGLVQLQTVAEREAAQRLSTPTAGQRLEVGPIDPRLRLTPCALPLTAKPAPGMASRNRLVVEIRCAAPDAWHLYVPVRIVGVQHTVRATHALLTGEVLRDADIEIIDLDMADLPPGSLDGQALAIGQTVARPIAKGSLLSNRDLMAAPAIQKGQTVTLLARNGAMDIKMAGRALDDALINQRVRATNTSSGRVVDGVATSRGVVEVNLPAL
jgi:flagellar basal body P-ring formation protein FlgA